MVQYPRPYGFTRLYASRSEDLTVTSLTQTCLNPAPTSTPREHTVHAAVNSATDYSIT
jgi:hypothetical protein